MKINIGSIVIRKYVPYIAGRGIRIFLERRFSKKYIRIISSNCVFYVFFSCENLREDDDYIFLPL